MKNNTEPDVELPWQMELRLMGRAVLLSGVGIFLLFAVGQLLVNGVLEGGITSPEGTTVSSFSLVFFWPAWLILFIASSARVYCVFKRMLICRISYSARRGA